MADNYRIDVVSDRKDVFAAALRLAFINDFSPAKAEFWTVNNGSLILLKWVSESEKAQQFPFALTIETAIPFCWEWLQQQEYGPEPDQDGSNKRGFWITTTDAKNYRETDIWMMPGGFHGGIVRISPEWCMYGK